MSGIKIIYSDVAVGAKTNFAPVTTEIQTFSNIQQIQQDINYKNYTNPCELYQTLLDDSAMEFLPDDLSTGQYGLWSLQQSNNDGLFTTPIVLTLTATQLYTSQGVTLLFDDFVGQWCNDVNIKWYNGTTLLNDLNFAPDSATYFCQNRVVGYNKLVITFKKMNMPNVYLKLQTYEHGVIRNFFNDELASTTLTQEISPVSEQISINTFDFTLKSKNDVEYIFQSRQPIQVYFNDELKAVHFINKSNRTSKNTWSISTIDYIGLLDSTEFLGGIYTNYNAFTLATDIFQNLNIPFEMDNSLKTKTVTGYIPICASRLALQHLAFAIGAVVDTSNTDKVEISVLNTTVKKLFTLNETYTGQSNDLSANMTRFELTEHAFIESNESIDVYRAEDSGIGNNIFVTFPQPLHNLSIVSGSILQSGANYAIINATNESAVLKGDIYTHTKKVIAIDNPLTLVTDVKKVVKIENATLISTNNSQLIAQKCYNYFLKSNTLKNKLVCTDEKVGDLIEVQSEFLANTIGYIESMKYNLNGSIIAAEIEVKSNA